MKKPTSAVSALLTTLILSISAIACAGEGTAQNPESEPTTAATAPTESVKQTPPSGEAASLTTTEPNDADATPAPSAEMCQEGDARRHRLNDLAEHVYDGAVSKYLLENASTVGREITPDSEAYAMMLLADGKSYETCVEVPERCLRIQFLKASSQKERDALLAGAASYTYDRALACLQRAGEAYAAERPTPEMEARDLEAKYRERILPRLIGNMMPVAMLADSSFFGTDNGKAHRLATEVWEDCLQTLSNKPVETKRLAERVSEDMTAVLDCVEELHEKIPEWAEPPTAGGSPTPENTETPTAKPEPTPTPAKAPAPSTDPAPTTTPTATDEPPPAPGFPDTEPGKDWTRHTARNRGGGQVFSIMLPPGWEITTTHGIDSFVGEIRGEGILLRFDLGWYSQEPQPERDPQNEYIVLRETIGGNEAKLVLAADPPEERGEDHRAVTAVYFGHLHERNRLVMAGEGLTREQQETAAAIFRSTRIGQPDQETGQNPPDNENPSVTAARKAAARHLTKLLPGNEQRLALVLQEPVRWPDAALGCPQEGMAYAQVKTPGYRITLAHGGGTITVHTDQTGRQAVVPQNCLESPQAAVQPTDDGRTVHAKLAPAGAPCPADSPGAGEAAPLEPPILDGREYQLCSGGQKIGIFRGSHAPPHPSLIPARIAESAVQDVYIQALEKHPVAYRLVAASSRTSGNCTQHAGYELRRIGRSVHVRILHHQTTVPKAQCTKDIQEDRTVVPLGTDFPEGTEHTLQVNGWTGTLNP